MKVISQKCEEKRSMLSFYTLVQSEFRRPLLLPFCAWAQNSYAWAQPVEYMSVSPLPVCAWAPEVISIATSDALGRKMVEPRHKFTFQVAYLSPNIRF